MAPRKSVTTSDGETTTTITATASLDLPADGKTMTYEELNPKGKASEFFGPFGTAVVSLGCPFIAYMLFFGCNETLGCPPTNTADWKLAFEGLLGNWPASQGKLWDWKAAGAYFAWHVYCVLCWVLIPVEPTEGTLLRNGRRKTYWMSCLYGTFLTLGLVLGYLIQPGGVERFTWIYDNWVPLTSAALVMAFAQATWVYIWSFFSGELVALGGNSGNFIYDWFMGRPLNPTFPGLPNFDIKTYNEVRPGITGWILLNISCACEQYVRLGRVTDGMILVLIFQAYYCFDSHWNETIILNQIDITTDGYGFMLAFGDLVWLPFTYSLQARYLAFSPKQLGPINTALIVLIEGLGIYIFSEANKEKHNFRNGKNPKNLTYMETKRGTKLLTSGWWGRSRHPNYLGDILMALGMCLPTGFDTPITYFYLIFLTTLLCHRQVRDDEVCRKKYGKDWEKYTELVPYKIVPYIY